MADLSDIDGIGAKAIELLAELDIDNLEALADQKTAELYARLYELNRKEKVYDTLPQIHTVEEWVAAARILNGVGAGAGAPDDGAASLATVEELVGLEPSAWMRLYEDAREARVITRPAPKPDKKRDRRLHKVPPRKNTPVKPQPREAREAEGDEASRQSTAGKLAKHGSINPRLGIRPSPDDEEAVLRGNKPKKERRSGPKIDPEKIEDTEARRAARTEQLPRRARRGLKHPHPGAVIWGSFVVLTMRLLFFLMIFATPVVLIFFAEDREKLLYFAIIPALLLIFTLFYAFAAPRVRCRVCSAPVLVTRNCRKHENSHRLFGLGWVGSLALHAVLFGWFRCQYCGSAMRLRG